MGRSSEPGGTLPRAALRKGLRFPALAALLLSSLLPSTGGASTALRSEAQMPFIDASRTLTSGGILRTYRIHIPPGPVPRSGYPLVLAFHGGGMTGAGMARMTGFDRVADARGFIVVYPEGIDRHWNDGRATIKDPKDDVGFVSALIERLEHGRRIDSRRIYATGISNGALFAERLGCDLSGRIAGIAAVAGTLPVKTMAACHAARPVAVLQIDGNADPIMPYGGGRVKDFGGRGEGGVVTSVASTAAFWARNNGCGAQGRVKPLPVRVLSDPTRITARRYRGCPATAPVSVLTVDGGGHVWPGSTRRAFPRITGAPSQQIDASAAIATFFLSLPPA